MIRNSPDYAGAGPLPLLYLIGAVILALAIGVETYFQNDTLAAVRGGRGRRRDDPVARRSWSSRRRCPRPATRVDPATGQPIGDAMPGYLRLLTPVMNIPGALSLLLGAVFSTYVFMPKRRVLPYSLDPNQPGDQFLFNLLIAPVAILVNLVASLPAAFARARSPAASTRACRRRS